MINNKITQNIKTKRRAHSIVKKNKNNNDYIKDQYFQKKINLRVIPSLNIISKSNIKNESFDNISLENSSLHNKKIKIFNNIIYSKSIKYICCKNIIMYFLLFISILSIIIKKK